MGKIEIVLGLIKKFPVSSIEDAVRMHFNYNIGKGASESYFSVILTDGEHTHYISYNGRVWNWDEKDNPYRADATNLSKTLFDKFMKNNKGGVSVKELIDHLEFLVKNGHIKNDSKIILTPEDCNKEPYFLMFLPEIIERECVIKIK